MAGRIGAWSGLGILILAGCNAHLAGEATLPPEGTGPSPAATASLAPTAPPTPAPQPPQSYRLFTIAGNGVKGDSQSGAAALATSLFSPAGLVMAPDGSLYLADYKINKVRRVDPAGIISLVAGTTFYPSDSGVDGPAIDAGLAKPYALAWHDGQLVFSQYGYSVPGSSIPGRVFQIDRDGVLRRIAGGGSLDVTNGVSAKDANLLGPEGLTYDAQGNLYVAEYDGHRVDRIDPQGVLTVIAGTGEAGNAGDHGPATLAKLSSPNWLVFDRAGNLLVVDSANQNVRTIGPDGTIRTLVGTGDPTNDPAVAGYLASKATHLRGDGGPAIAATLHTPTAAAVDAFGDVLIGDSENYAIRRVDAHGLITTVAGTGQLPDATSSALPDGTPATQVALNLPDGLFMDASGSLYFSEYGGYKVRKLAE